MYPVRRLVLENPPERTVEVVALQRVDVHDLAHFSGRDAALTLLPRWVEQLVVTQADAQPPRLGGVHDLLRLRGVDGERFLDVDMGSSVETAERQRPMRVRRRGDVDDIGPGFSEHPLDVVEDPRNPEPRRRLTAVGIRLSSCR